MIAVVGSGLLSQQTSAYLGNASVAAWNSEILTIFTLALSLPLSQAADYWGRRWMITIPSLLAIAGFLIVSRAHNIATLLAGFCVSGPAFGTQTLFNAIASEVVPRKYRAAAQASLGATTGVGGVLGVVMGGLLMRGGNPAHFRIFWYVAAAVYAVGTAGVFFGYKPPPRELERPLGAGQKMRELDWLGYGMFTAGITLFCVALQWSNNPYGWDNAHVLAPFVISVLVLFMLGIHQWKFRTDGLFHHRLFSDRNFVVSVTSMFVEGLSFFTTNSYFVMELLQIYHLDFFSAVEHFMIMFISSLAVAPFIGLYSTWRKSVRSGLIAGFLILLVWNIVMATRKTSDSSKIFYGLPVLAGAGLALILPMAITTAQLSTPPELISTSTGITTSARGVGGAVGLAINNAVFQRGLTSNLGEKVAAALASYGFPLNNLDSVIAALSAEDADLVAQALGGNQPLIAAVLEAATEAHMIAFRNAWITASCFSALGLAGEQCESDEPRGCWLILVQVACFIRNPRSEFSGRIDAAVDAVQHSDEKLALEAGSAGHETVDLSAKPEREGETIPI